MSREIIQLPQALEYLLINYQQIIVYQDISEKSRERYMYDAEDFITFVADNGFGEGVLLKFKEYLKSRADLSASTKKGKLRIAKTLCESLWHRGLTKANISKEVKNFKVTVGHKKQGLDQSEVDRIFNYFETLPYQEEISYKLPGEKDVVKTIKTHKYRNILLTSLLAFQGLRQFEVCGLLIEDVSIANKTAKIKGKMRDDKEVIDLHPKTIEAIKSHLNDTEDKSGFLIKSRQKKQLTQSAIRHVYTNKENGIFKLCDIEGKSVHGFRHYFVTELLKAYKDPAKVMRFARLRSMQTIQVYDDRIGHEEDLELFRDLF